MKSIIFALSLLVHLFAYSSACKDASVVLQVLGSGGPELSDRRASSSYLVWVNGKARVLVDTGAGSSLNFERSGAKFKDLAGILFTHLHVDHSVDFPSYIKASFFTRRSKDLLVYGPAANDLMPATTSFVNKLLGRKGAYAYLDDYIDRTQQNDYHIRVVDIVLNRKELQEFHLNKNIKLKTITVFHGPVAAIAWRVEIGKCIITFSGDMSNHYATLATLAQGSDILVAHNAISEDTKGVARRLHMPPSEIGKIAKQAKVKKLVLSHRMLRTLGTEKKTKKIIRQFYQGPISFADDMARY